MNVAEYGRKVLLAGNVETEILQESIFDAPMDLSHDECDVQDVPPGVRCFACGKLHGS